MVTQISVANTAPSYSLALDKTHKGMLFTIELLIALTFVLSGAAVDFFGVELSTGCADYIRKSDTIVAKVGPQFQALEDAGKGSSVEKPATDANKAVQSALKLYNAQKNGVLQQEVRQYPNRHTCHCADQ